jgi:hypothetical protein
MKSCSFDAKRLRSSTHALESTHAVESTQRFLRKDGPRWKHPLEMPCNVFKRNMTSAAVSRLMYKRRIRRRYK